MPVCRSFSVSRFWRASRKTSSFKKFLPDARPGRRRRNAFRRDAHLAQGFRRFVRKHGGGGETGGILDTILQRLSTYNRKERQAAARRQSALVYPVGVLSVAAGVITLFALEGRSDFRHLVRGPWRGPAAAPQKSSSL